MTLSLFDLFSIGIGPSSSHTVGPMRAVNDFLDNLTEAEFAAIDRVKIDLYGSLALTGVGHGTDKAVINGLLGFTPETVDPDTLVPNLQHAIDSKQLLLRGEKQIPYQHDRDFCLHQKTFLPTHSNGLRLSAFDQADKCIASTVYYSVGGGFIVTEDTFGEETAHTQTPQPYPFNTGETLLRQCEAADLTVPELMMANEKVWRSETEILDGIRDIEDVMLACIDKGCQTPGHLPGGLQVKRRAPELFEKLNAQAGIASLHEARDVLNYLNMYAMAVNEENAAGGRIVTAPTNGAAGIIPAVLKYYKAFHHGATQAGVIDYFLTAAAIGILYKLGASISGAEVGCQGEVGVASSMAAAGLTAAMGGNVLQIENAAEIAMEHHLGMTCDPVNGLVQIPCIERNAMGAVKAVNAARMALIGDGQHHVSLDKVINTMWQTGHDMMTIYKETSLGGLAVNVPEC